MTRSLLAALLALVLASPALAETCKRVTDRVQFCPAGSAWDGIEGKYFPKLRGTGYRVGDTALVLGVVPDFVRPAFDGTAQSLTAVVDAFGGDGAIDEIEPSALSPDRPVATAAFAPQDGIVELLSVMQSGNELVLVQTMTKSGTGISDDLRAKHAAALAALKENAE
jgi:hypothetical protein